MKNHNTIKLELGKEYISSDEDVIIQEMVNEMQDQMKRVYEKEGKFMPRQVHTKMHGCVKGRFVINPDLEDDLKIGVFKDSKSFHCYVRFSNSQTIPKPDKKKDIRGIAIKLLGVKGEKALNNHRDCNVQDFLLMSSETFFSKNIVEFRQTLKSSTAKSKLKLLLYFLAPKHWGLFKRLLKTFVKCDNPLDIPYWSTQPYRFGKDYKAVKYFLKPSPDNKLINETFNEDDYLKTNLSQTLASHSAKFDFFIQFQTDAEKMPIEDPTIPWDSQYIKVATLEIPSQEFDTKSQVEFGENLSFNSWHTLTEHRPLGSFNRARRRAYEAMSAFRHEYNNTPNKEPEDEPNFLINTSWPEEHTIDFEIPKKKCIHLKSQVVIDCSKKTAFEFLISNDEIPNWLKKVGMIHAALNTKVLTKSYDFVGAKRKMYFDGGNSILEEILSYRPYSNYTYKISEFTNITKLFSTHAYAQIWFDRDTETDHTRVTWDYFFTAKNGLSKLILKILLPSKFKKFMDHSLQNAKAYIENGD